MDATAFPKGYLDLIGSKNRGEGVRLAQDYLVPVVDIGILLKGSRQAMTEASQANLGPNFVNMITVPLGRTWIIQAGSLNVNTPAASTVTDLSILVFPAEGTNNGFFCADPIQVAASRTGITLWRFPQVTLQGGTRIGTYAAGVTGGPNPASIILFHTDVAQ